MDEVVIMQRIICVGDSITWGEGVFPHLSSKSWPAILEQKLGDDFEVINLGLNGACLLDNGVMPYFQQSLSRVSYNYEADVILFMLGTNDAKPIRWDAGLFTDALRKRAEDYLALSPRPQVFLMIPPPQYVEVISSYSTDDSIIRGPLRQAIEQVADELDLALIDLYTPLANQARLFPDGSHPNSEANQIMADEIYRVLERKYL